jgi:hypothetical protein
MLVGRKGKEVEPGYIFVPYVMTQSITTIIESKNYFRKAKISRILGISYVDSMIPKLGIKSGYATKKINNNFYTTIDIKKSLN